MEHDEMKVFKVNDLVSRSRDLNQRLICVQNSVFVEFADFSSVNAFLKADPKPAWDGKDLLIMSKYVIVACDYLRYSICLFTGRSIAT
jgi:hypothetical protein